jgi:hypothetical protein
MIHQARLRRLAVLCSWLIALSIGLLSVPTPVPAAEPDAAIAHAGEALKQNIDDLMHLFGGLASGLKAADGMLVSGLAKTVKDERDAARPKARLIPPAIRAALVPYFRTTPFVLDRARWVNADEVGAGLTALVLLNPDVAAITLDDVIVFRDKGAAEKDAALWAHELVHVLQYAALGIDGFVEEYVKSGGQTLEHEAYGFAEQVRQKLAVNPPKPS